MRHLGERLSHVGPGRAHIVLPTRPEVTQQHGYVHAGATSAIADTDSVRPQVRIARTTATHAEDVELVLVATGQQTLIKVTRPS